MVAVALHVIGPGARLGAGRAVRCWAPTRSSASRFFGAGNELEIALAAIGLLGLGGALATASSRVRVWGFAVGGGALAFALAWGRLGADVGAVPDGDRGRHRRGARVGGGHRWGGRGSRSCWSHRSPGLPRWRCSTSSTGGDAHFSRSVLEAGGLDEIADVAERRVRLSYRSLGRGIDSRSWSRSPSSGWRSGSATAGPLLASTEGFPGVRAAVYGLLAAVLVGALTNDSGPIILLIGSSYLLFTAVYLAAVRRPGRTDRCDEGIPDRLPPTRADSIAPMRIALVSPYSWTFPGGVTRHIDALAREFIASGHHVRVLAPVDPDDRLTRRLHRRAPDPEPLPDFVVPLGRTVALPMNGAMSRLSVSPEAVLRLAPGAARRATST